jgi:hypothetical protein
MGFWIFVIALAVIWLLFSKKKVAALKVNSKIITKINHSSQQKSLNQPASSVTNMHSQASDDDELATFSFVNGQAVEYSTSRQPSRKAPPIAIPRQRDGSNREKASPFKTSSLITVIFISADD